MYWRFIFFVLFWLIMISVSKLFLSFHGPHSPGKLRLLLRFICHNKHTICLLYMYDKGRDWRSLRTGSALITPAIEVISILLFLKPVHSGITHTIWLRFACCRSWVARRWLNYEYRVCTRQSQHWFFKTHTCCFQNLKLTYNVVSIPVTATGICTTTIRIVTPHSVRLWGSLVNSTEIKCVNYSRHVNILL